MVRNKLNFLALLISLLLINNNEIAQSKTLRQNFITEAEFEYAKSHLPNINNSVVFNPPHNNPYLSNERNAWKHTQWPNGIIPYTLDPNFSDSERIEVAIAFRNYYSNTCLRFIPKEANDESWVDILRDDNTCGVAHVCKQNGGQFAKFGGGCINSGVMTHELGHTICFGHEQSRFDRDDWISWNQAICSPHGKDSETDWTNLDLLYDYVSLQHYEGECYHGCIVPKVSGVTKCGSGGPLSVLDIEKINAYYQCPGCNSYRFRPLSKIDKPESIVIAGYDLNNIQLNLCRTYYNGDIIIGKGRADSGECWVTYHGAEHSYRGQNVEFLTHPWDQNSQFSWIRKLSDGNIPFNAIRGGRSAEREPLYIGRCLFNVNSHTSILLPGKIQKSASNNLYVGFGGREYTCSDYEILVCQ